jgi:hypothetical protein
MRRSSKWSTFVGLSLIATLFLLVGSYAQHTCAQVKGINTQASNSIASFDLRTKLGSRLIREVNPELAWFNLTDWMYLLNRSEPQSPEGVLAHVIASIFTRDTGALASKIGNSSIQYGLDRWLTNNGKQNKKKLASLDTSSPWPNTLTVTKAQSSANGTRRTYWLKGTARTSEPGVFYPIEFSIQLVKNSQGRWLANDFEVISQQWERR